MRRQVGRWGLAPCLIVGLVSCAGQSNDQPTDVDAGTGNLWLPIDAGVMAGGRDAGDRPALDAGTDAGLAIDGGMSDAGAPVAIDAGAVIDAGVSVDAGTDAGLTADAGVVDGGLDAGAAESLALEVSANLNNVVSARAQVAWSGPLASVYITYSADGGDSGQTPATSLSDTTSPVTLPVLALSADTPYVFQAIAVDTLGSAIVSNMAELTTGDMPATVALEVTPGSIPTPGYTMVARYEPIAPMYDDITIVDGSGRVVWYYDAPPGPAGEFTQQPDATFTIGIVDTTTVLHGFDTGVHAQVDQLGNLLHVWLAVNVPATVTTDLVRVVATNVHELRLLPDGDGLLFGNVVEHDELSDHDRYVEAAVVGDVLERVTVEGELAFSWNAFQYLSLSDIDPACTAPVAPVVDFTHLNAIDITDDGNYLVSSRNLSQLVKIDSTTGDVIWKLGGHGSSFTFANDPLYGFSCQHGARELPNGDIIVFDDGNGHAPKESRAAQYSLDLTSMTATLVWSASANPPLFSSIMGFAQRLDDGNTLITYGANSQAQEVDPDGDLLWDLSCADPNVEFYRAIHIDSLYGPSQVPVSIVDAGPPPAPINAADGGPAPVPINTADAGQ